MTEIEKSFLTPSLSVDYDSDGNVIITQLSKDIFLTPRQCLELVEVLKVVREVTGENKCTHYTQLVSGNSTHM